MIFRTKDQVGDTMVHYEGMDKTENYLHTTVSTTTGPQLTNEDRANIADMARHPCLQAISTDPTRLRPAKVALPEAPNVHGVPHTTVPLHQISRVTPLSYDLPHHNSTSESHKSHCRMRHYPSPRYRHRTSLRPSNMVTYTRTQPNTR